MQRDMNRGLAALVVAALAVPAGAIRAPDALPTPEGRALLAPLPLATVAFDPETSAAWAKSDPAWQAFLRAHPGTWNPRFDACSGRLSFAWGSGIDWLPAGAEATDRSTILDLVESRARAFMADNAGLYRVPSGVELVRNEQLSGVSIDGRVAYLRFTARVKGLDAHRIAAFFHLNSGRLVQFGVGAITDDLGSAPTRPAVDEATVAGLATGAIAAVLGLPSEAAIRPASAARLVLLPTASADGRGIVHRLCWEQHFRVEGRPETWLLVHDAVSGERLAFSDDNRYACPPPPEPWGRVVGGVFLGPIETTSEVVRPLPHAAVSNDTEKVADGNGIFPFTLGSEAVTTLSGRYFDLNCVECSNPPQASARSSRWADLSLGVGGDNATGNGVSTKAERNVFYHASFVRQLASEHVTDAQAGGFLSSALVANVHGYAFTCNAWWWFGQVAFMRAGGGCNNAGEIASVAHHEWGHGLDEFTGGARDRARGEGFADVISVLGTHDAAIAPFLYLGNPAGLRNVDEDVAGLKTRTTIDALCPIAGFGPLGREEHCEGELTGQTWWHVARNLRAKYGDTAGWDVVTRLFFEQMPIAHWSVYQNVPGGETVQYDGLALVDDDDGNLANGTPNADAYNDAFIHHEIEGTPPYRDSAECTPPETPPVALSAQLSAGTRLWQVRVAWPPVACATEYVVHRNDTSPGDAWLQVATILPPATEFLDDDVMEGLTYNYRVTVTGRAGCRSIADDGRAIPIDARPDVPAIPGPVGNWLRPTGRNYDHDSVELTWAGADLESTESFALRRADAMRPAAAWITVSPEGLTDFAFRDTAATGALHFYVVVRESCAGVLGPDSP